MVEAGGLWFCLCRVCIVGESSKDGVVLEWTLVDNFIELWLGAVYAILLLAMFPVCSVLQKKLEFGVTG
jgi:hypothetical protein